MAAKASPTAKSCERCESFFPNIKSTTCPQCFAPLTPLTDDEAQAVLEAQAARMRDPEYQQVKTVEDETFKEQSFGACLGIVGVFVACVIASIVFISFAAKRHPVKPSAAPPVAIGILPALLDNLLPAELDGARRLSAQTDMTLPGANHPLCLGVYEHGIQVFAYPEPTLTHDQLNAFRLVAQVASRQHTPPLAMQESVTNQAYYAVLAPSAADASQAAHALAP
jgi:hypothetical protein